MTEIQKCKYLDSTGEVLCLFEGRYKTTRGKPSLAQRGVSDIKVNGVLLVGMPVLVCKPAAILHACEKGENDDEWLVEQQRPCSEYKKPSP